MKLARVLVASLLALNLPLTATVEAQTATGDVSRIDATQAKPHSSLLAADCKETAVMPATLPARPTLRRATVASHPTHHSRKAHRARKPVRSKRVAGKHRPKHRRRHAAHRPGPTPLRLHRVTYASPLCSERSSAMNTMLGLPDYTITQPPEAASVTAIEDTGLDVPAIFGDTGGGTGGPGPVFPTWPVIPIGPGPIIIFPGGPVGPIGPGPPVGPVTPPTPPIAVPEPASWATMMMGMALVGGSMRRRQRRPRKKV